MPTSSTDRLYRGAFIVAAIFYVVVEAWYFSYWRLPLDGFQHLVGRDFMNMWVGARQSLFGNPAVLFDAHHYNALLHRMFSPQLSSHNWSYPPHIFLLIWPFGMLPYLTAYALWVSAGLGLLIWSARGGGARGRQLLFLLLAPVTFLNVVTGQNGFFTGVLLVAAMTIWDRRPILAGVLLGLLSVKPQMVLLMPVALVMTQRRRVLGAAAATTALLIAASAAIWGLDVWRDYIQLALPFQRLALTHGQTMMEAMMPTPYMNARLAGASVGVATSLQVAGSLTALAAVVWSYARPRDPLLSMTMLLAASLIVTPYAFNYDMVALTLVLSQLMNRHDNTATDEKLIFLLWLLPAAIMLLGIFHIAGSALVLLALMARLWQRMKEPQTLSSPQPLGFGIRKAGDITGTLPAHP